MSHTDRVVILVDMDCFYCQVEEKLNPTLKGKPVAVVQYNQWQGGGIIAVNYEARSRGVTRHMRGKEAQAKCPEIELVRVPNIRGKADLTKYREAGKSVAKVLLNYTPLLERASVDEAYLDVTELVKSRLEATSQNISIDQLKNTYTIGGDTIDFLYNLYNSGLSSEANLRLAWGGVIAEEIRTAVYEETGYTCSAGISHNKILAKLSCGINKPNKQTILSLDSVEELYKNLPVRKIKSLGGKFGNTLSEDLEIKNMGELIKFSEKQLAKRYDEKTASWLYNIARGIDMEPVTARLTSKSIGCCKKFPGGSALKTVEKITHWLNELAIEIVERLEQDYVENNRRKAKQMIVSFAHNNNGKEIAGTRTLSLNSYDVKKITNDAFEVVKKNCGLKKDGSFRVTFLGINASKFEEHKNVNEITSFFKVSENLPSVSNFQNDSNLTVDLHEDSSDLKFFNEDNSDHDSITEELPKENNQEQAGSFFLRYFENFKKPPSPTQRDFNTSLNLIEEDLETNDTELELASTSCFQDPEQQVFICNKCGERVPELDRISHADYHFAMDLVKNETEMRRVEPKVAKPAVKKGGSKRKSAEREKNSTLTSFFKNDENEAGKTEVCPQCNKKFHSHEFVSHLDYHAAKRLHLEINELQTPPIQISSIKNKTNQVTKQKANGVRSVRSFFKTVD